jgi:PAS domain S-box-containing protein
MTSSSLLGDIAFGPATGGCSGTSAEGAFVVILDAGKCRHVEVSQGYCLLLEYERGEILGRTPLELGIIPGEEHMAGLLEIAGRGGGGHCVLPLRTKSGGIRKVSSTSGWVELDGSRFLIWTGIDVTGQGQREESLRQNAEGFRAIFENAAIGIAKVGPDGRILLSNAHFCKLLGYDPGELDGMHIRELMHPEDAGHHRTGMEALATGREAAVAMEQRFIRKDGGEIWVFASISMVRDRSGRPAYAIGVLKDITERKVTEERLRASREQFLKIFRATPFLILISTVEEGRLVEVNRAFEEVMGYSREQVLGKRSDDLGLWVDLGERERLKRLLLEHGRFHNEEMRVRRKDGAERVMLVSGELIQFGGQMCVIGGAQDITEQKRSTAALRESEENFRAVFEGTLEAIYVHDFQGRFLEVNGKGMELLGYSREELLQKTPMEFDAHADRIPERFETLVREGSLSFETEIIGRDGSHLPVEINTQVIHYGGEPAILGVVRDIRERRRAEDELRNLASRLEDRVRERTMELEQANSAKNEFLANMSHEIRTPLSGILGMADLTLLQAPPGELRENLEMIRSSALSLNTIINDLLDFSAIEAGRLSIRPLEFSLRDELAKLAGGFEEQARLKGLFFGLSVDDGVPERVVTDPARVRQILINLVNNAVKFTLEGSVRLDVRSPDSDHLALSVSDTGIGIPSDRIKDLFQSFTQLESTVTKRFGGTGLGLAISKNLAELMGGTIGVESREGVGSVFTLIVPIEIPDEQERKPEQRAVPEPAIGRPLRILLAEDNPVNQLVIRRLLARQGHFVRVAASGRQVLEELKGSEFDLVIMDVQMPEMDGLDATRAIRHGEGGRNPATIPIIALTAYAMKGDRERFIAAGMDGYVTKPVDFDELARTIAEVCRGG